MPFFLSKHWLSLVLVPPNAIQRPWLRLRTHAVLASNTDSFRPIRTFETSRNLALYFTNRFSYATDLRKGREKKGRRKKRISITEKSSYKRHRVCLFFLFLPLLFSLPLTLLFFNLLRENKIVWQVRELTNVQTASIITHARLKYTQPTNIHGIQHSPLCSPLIRIIFLTLI